MDLASNSGESRPRTHGSVRLWLRLVGEFEAQIESGQSALPVSKKARALLSLVAAHMPQPLRRDYAAGLLWSTKPREHAANSLRQALRELQIALAICGQPPVLLTGSGRLTLRSESVWIDIHDPMAIKWRTLGDGSAGPLLLCQNLQGLDPALDAHLERLWKNLVFQQAFVPSEVLADDADGLPGNAASGSPDLDEGPALDRGRPDAGRGEAPSDEAAQGWRIAVLPFRSLGKPLEGGLSLGMAEEVSAALARFRMPRLIATSSFWNGTGPAEDSLARCRTFNLDYVISGTIQTSGSRIRVTVTLLDVSMDLEVIWACRFEGTTDDLFSLQDKIASQTVAQIDPELLQRHQYRHDHAVSPDGKAHHLLLTAIQGIYRPDQDKFLMAKDHLLKAIELDPDYAAAHAWLAYWYVIGLGQGWVSDAQEAGTQAGLAAERAIALDPLDARGLTIAGHVKAYLLHDPEGATVLHERATSLNPNLPIAWALSAWANVYCGRHRKAVENAVIAESLSPADPHIFFVEHASMMAHLFLKDLTKADTLAMSSLERKPRHASTLRGRLAILGHLGKLDEAARCLAALQLIDPSVTVEKIMAIPPFRSHDMEYYEAGLRKAGVPTRSP